MSNCIIAQSGGPTSVINASLCGAIEKAISSSKISKIYGSTNGILGILQDTIIDLSSTFEQNPDKLEILKTTPGMYLGSCRFKLKNPSHDDSQFKSIFSTFSKYNIKYFFYIGGNDSMDTVYKLSKYAQENNIDVKIRLVLDQLQNLLQHQCLKLHMTLIFMISKV
jgi:6-phosphofructokinase 1